MHQNFIHHLIKCNCRALCLKLNITQATPASASTSEKKYLRSTPVESTPDQSDQVSGADISTQDQSSSPQTQSSSSPQSNMTSSGEEKKGFSLWDDVISPAFCCCSRKDGYEVGRNQEWVETEWRLRVTRIGCSGGGDIEQGCMYWDSQYIQPSLSLQYSQTGSIAGIVRVGYTGSPSIYNPTLCLHPQNTQFL